MSWLQPVTLVLLFFAGIFVYRWQKFVDRQSEIAKERRDAYREVIQAMDDFMLVFFSEDRDERDKGHSRYRVARRKATLVGSSWVLKALERHTDALESCRKVMSNEQAGLMEDVLSEVRAAEAQVLTEMRRDFVYGLSVRIADMFPKSLEVRQ